MPRGKRAESNGLAEAQALAAKEAEGHEPETEAVEDAEDGDEAPGPGHNGPAELTEDQRIALTFQHKKAYESALATKKAADAALKNSCKLAKAELGPDAVSDIKHMIELETEEGESKFKAKVEREVRIARWMGLPVGANGNLFEAVDRTPAVDRAAAAGKRAGLAGDRCENPHDSSTPQYAAFMTGYGEGQKAAFSIKPLAPAVNASAEAADEFDTIPSADEPPAPEATH